MQRIFEKNRQIISDIINRFIDCMQLEEIYAYGNIKDELDSVFKATSIKKMNMFWEISDTELTYVRLDDSCQLELVGTQIKEKRIKQDFIIYSPNQKTLEDISVQFKVEYYNLENISLMTGGLIFMGKTFDKPIQDENPDDFKVLAIMHFYNEADILEKTIKYLLSQGVDIYLLDNWSEDRSYEIALEIQNEYPNRIYLERFPASGKTQYYEWYNQLQRTEEIQRELDYKWYIHYDADEMRVSPWKGENLLQFLFRVDQLGYNLVENTVIDHKLTDLEDDIFMQDTFFDFGHAMTHFQQVKTWKRADKIDLKSSGGHIAQIENPKIFPLKILNRHYPLRNIEQAKKKVFIDRKLRFEKENKERGWHGHYNKISGVNDLINNKSTLLKWEKDAQCKWYIPMFTGCGIWRDYRIKPVEINKEIYTNKKIVIYGAGSIGKKVYMMLQDAADIVAWADSANKQYGMIFGKKIQSFDEITGMEADYFIIAIKNKEAQKEIKKMLVERHISENRIKSI